MSFDEMINKGIEDNPEVMPCSEIPDKIDLILVSFKHKEDARGNKAIYLTLRTKSNKRVIQKYTASSYVTLKRAIDDAGGFEFLTHTLWTWTKGEVGQMKMPRLLPVPEHPETTTKTKPSK